MRENNGRMSPFRYKLTKHPATSCHTLYAPHVKLISCLLNVVQSLADSNFESTFRFSMVSDWGLHRVSELLTGGGAPLSSTIVRASSHFRC